MTIDIDAIRASATHYTGGTGGNQGFLAHQLAATVPALLARVDEQAAEIQRLRASGGNWVNCTPAWLASRPAGACEGTPRRGVYEECAEHPGHFVSAGHEHLERGVAEASESRIESAIAQAFDQYATQPYGDLRLNAKRAALIATAAIRDLLGEASTKVEPTEPQYLIWSHHHKAWWGPGGSGYRSHIADAGRYALADTKQWLSRGCGCCMVPEVVVPAPPLVTFESPSGLAQFAKEQIHNATARRIGAGQVNTYAAISEITR